MPLFQKDDVLTYRDVNLMKQLWASTSAPANPGTGEVWMDILQDPPQLKRWAGSAWTVIGASNFIKKDADDTFSGMLTSTKTNKAVIKFDNGDSMITVHDGFGNFNIKSGVDENNLAIINDGGSHIRMDEAGRIYFIVSVKPMGQPITYDVYMSITSTGISLVASSGVNMTLSSAGIAIDGSTELKTEMVIPTAPPANYKDGNLWIS